MKKAFFLIAVSFMAILSSCNHNDDDKQSKQEEQKNLLIGEWVLEEEVDNGKIKPIGSCPDHLIINREIFSEIYNTVDINNNCKNFATLKWYYKLETPNVITLNFYASDLPDIEEHLEYLNSHSYKTNIKNLTETELVLYSEVENLETHEVDKITSTYKKVK